MIFDMNIYNRIMTRIMMNQFQFLINDHLNLKLMHKLTNCMISIVRNYETQLL